MLSGGDVELITLQVGGKKAKEVHRGQDEGATQAIHVENNPAQGDGTHPVDWKVNE